jgi:hypothetical protein
MPLVKSRRDRYLRAATIPFLTTPIKEDCYHNSTTANSTTANSTTVNKLFFSYSDLDLSINRDLFQFSSSNRLRELPLQFSSSKPLESVERFAGLLCLEISVSKSSASAQVRPRLSPIVF